LGLSGSGKIMQPVVLSVLQGKGPERREASFADLIFVLFIKKKNKGLRGHSGASQACKGHEVIG
jgi:hypothetical protein